MKTMKRGVLSVWLLIISICGYGQSAALEELLNTTGIKNAAVSLSVKRVKDGAEVVSYHQDMALTPASVVKILPSWFALQERGDAFRYRTNVFYTGKIENGILSGDIILSASGDPTLDSRYFPRHSFVNTLATAIQNAGIKQIAGKIIVEGGKSGTDIPGSWLWEDISNYYGAVYLPFNYRDNTCVIELQTGAVGTQAELVSVTPQLPDTEIRCEVKAGTANRDNAWIYGGPYSSVLCVKGTLPANRKSFKIKGVLHNPSAVFIHELEHSLAGKGISVSNKISIDTVRNKLAVFDSPNLEKIVFHTNKASVNLFAEALGALVGGEQWCTKVTDLLKKAGISTEGMTLKDACGLSPMNAVPARLFTDLLVYIGKQDHAAFLRSLPVAGVDGGLGGYCYSYPQLKNNLQAKTGSMTGVRCLSGYLTGRNGERLAFAILVNHYTCTVSQLQKVVGKFLSHLTE